MVIYIPGGLQEDFFHQQYHSADLWGSCRRWQVAYIHPIGNNWQSIPFIYQVYGYIQIYIYIKIAKPPQRRTKGLRPFRSRSKCSLQNAMLHSRWKEWMAAGSINTGNNLLKSKKRTRHPVSRRPVETNQEPHIRPILVAIHENMSSRLCLENSSHLRSWKVSSNAWCYTHTTEKTNESHQILEQRSWLLGLMVQHPLDIAGVFWLSTGQQVKVGKIRTFELAKGDQGVGPFHDGFHAIGNQSISNLFQTSPLCRADHQRFQGRLCARATRLTITNWFLRHTALGAVSHGTSFYLLPSLTGQDVLSRILIQRSQSNLEHSRVFCLLQELGQLLNITLGHGGERHGQRLEFTEMRTTGLKSDKMAIQKRRWDILKLQ